MDAEKITEIRQYLSDTALNGPKSGLNIVDVERTLRMYCWDLIDALMSPAPQAPHKLEPPPAPAPQPASPPPPLKAA